MKSGYKKLLLILSVMGLSSFANAYDIPKAMDYADTYSMEKYGYTVDSRFGGYRYINTDKNGGDCTNFVSQVLRAGGFKLSKSARGTMRDSYDKNTRYTRKWLPYKNTWVNANGLRLLFKKQVKPFVNAKKIVTIKSSYLNTSAGYKLLKKVRKGDVAFIVRRAKEGSRPKGTTGHAIVITGDDLKRGKGVTYSAHNGYANNKSIMDFSTGYKKIEFWRPQGKYSTQTEETTQNNTPSVYYRSGNLQFNKWLKGRLRGKVNNDDKEYAELLHHRKSTMRLYAIDESFEENTKVNIFMYSKSAKKPLIYVYHKDKNGKRVEDAKGRRYKNGRYNVSALSVTLKPRVKYFVEATTNKLEKNVKYYLYMSE